MNYKKTCRRLSEQLSQRNKADTLSGVAGRKKNCSLWALYVPAVASALLLVGPAHAVDINITNAKNNDVLYSYDAPSTTKISYGSDNGITAFCASGGPNYDQHTKEPGLGTFGLGLRQVSGYSVNEIGTAVDKAPFRRDGTTEPRPVVAVPPNTLSGDNGDFLSAGRVEIFVVNAKLLPKTTTILHPYAYQLGDGVWYTTPPASGISCGTPKGYMGTWGSETEDGVNRFPAPGGNVTLTVNATTGKTPHSVRNSGDHAGARQRLHNFVVTHKH